MAALRAVLGSFPLLLGSSPKNSNVLSTGHRGQAKALRWQGVRATQGKCARTYVGRGVTLATSGVARAEVKFVSGEEAKELIQEGYHVIDVRDKKQHERAHIVPSVHIPLFIENMDNDIGTVVNRTVHNGFSGLFFGIAFTKLNPDFVATVEQQFPKNTKLLLVCQEGLRSGYAAQNLQGAGYETLAYITQGLQKVKPGIFEKEGGQELEDAGKAGLVTIQGQFSIVLGTILILAYLFLQFFPDQAEQLFFKN